MSKRVGTTKAFNIEKRGIFASRANGILQSSRLGTAIGGVVIFFPSRIGIVRGRAELTS